MREVYGGVRVVTCACADLAATRAFYLDRLGLSPLRDDPARQVVVNVGTFRLRLVPADDARPATLGGPAFAFRVHDLGRTARELDRRGVPYTQRTERGLGDVLEIHDPDGRPLIFSELVGG